MSAFEGKADIDPMRRVTPRDEKPKEATKAAHVAYSEIIRSSGPYNHWRVAARLLPCRSAMQYRRNSARFLLATFSCTACAVHT